MRITLLFILLQFLFIFSTSAATWTVDNPTDTSVSIGGTASAGGISGDLRYCVSNALNGDVINFSLATPYTITLTADLVINNCVIDGTSQLSSTGIPLVSISGNYGIICQFSSGLFINSLRLINNPGRAAITLNSVDGVYIDGCFIGTDITGLDYSSVTPDTAIYSTYGSSNAFIGTYSPNVILTPSGIVLQGTSSCKIYSNMIGLNRKGMNPGGIKRNLNKGIELISGPSFTGSSANDIEYNQIGNCRIGAIVSDQNSNNNEMYYNIIGQVSVSESAPNGSGILLKGINNNTSYNTIANCAKISGSSGIGVEISGVNSYNNNVASNHFSCNQGGGVKFTNGSVAYQAPTFDSTSYDVYPDGSVTITGKANPGDYIQIYVVDSCSTFGTEGSFVQQTGPADAAGSWTYYGYLNVGSKITAIAVTTSPGNPSSFINPVNLVAFNCKGVVKAITGPNATTCSNSSYYLSGSVVNAADGNWSSSGTGYFYSGTSVYANSVNYTPSYADIEAGSVKLTLTTVSAIGGCPDTSASFTLSLPIPVAVTFGGDYYVYACPNPAGIPLDGKLINTTGGTWSTTGAGTFAAPANSLNNTYIPAASELNPDGFATFMLTPDQPGACPPVNGNFQMYFSSTDPVADAGSDFTACMNNPKVLLNTVSETSTVTELWTNKGLPIADSTYNNDGSISRYFKPTPADLSSGSVTLIYKVSLPGCVSDQDTLKINYLAPPVVFAGDSSAICGNATSFSLSKATVSNNPGGTVQWSGFATGGPKLHKLNATTDGNGFNQFSGTFEYDTLINTKYYPSPNDRTSLGGVYLILTAETAGKECSVSSYFPVTFSPVPDLVDAGADVTLCQGDSAFVNGLVSPSFPYKWTSAGTGKFLPVNDTINATYVPSKTDAKKVAFNLILNAGFPGCIVKDELLLILLPKPDVGVGYNQVICPNSEVTMTAAGAGIDQEGLWKVKKGSGEIPDSTNNVTQITNITADTNIYVWTITDLTTGCHNSAEYTVNYCYYPPLTVYNALSPNGDELGEFLEIEHIDLYKDNKVSIFNRWGEMVFKMDNYTNYKRQEGGPYDFSTGNAFTGRSNIGTTQDLPNGSYYYVIDKGSEGGKPEKGFLVIQK